MRESYGGDSLGTLSASTCGARGKVLTYPRGLQPGKSLPVPVGLRHLGPWPGLAFVKNVHSRLHLLPTPKQWTAVLAMAFQSSNIEAVHWSEHNDAPHHANILQWRFQKPISPTHSEKVELSWSLMFLSMLHDIFATEFQCKPNLIFK